MKFVYSIIYAGFYLFSLLPFRVLYFISDSLYLVVYRLLGYRKKVVRENLTSSFPEKDMKEIKELK